MSDETLFSHTTLRSRSAILQQVAHAIRQYQAASVPEADLVAAARMLCEDTRQRELPIERAIIDVKTTLLAEAPEFAQGDSLLETRARFIQMTIEEYYRS